MENPPIFKFGKPSISMGHGLIPWRTVSHNQRVYPIITPFFTIVNPLLNHEKSPFIVVKYPLDPM